MVYYKWDALRCSRTRRENRMSKWMTGPVFVFSSGSHYQIFVHHLLWSCARWLTAEMCHYGNKHQSSQETYPQLPSMSWHVMPMSPEVTCILLRQNKHSWWESRGGLHGRHRRDINWGVNRQKWVQITDDGMENRKSRTCWSMTNM